MNKKGFTLIELIGVITIMALIVLVVFPSTVKLLSQNTQKKYKYYYDAVTEGALVYSGTMVDDLGGNEGVGCIEVDLDTLIEEDYVKPFDEKEIKCYTPTDSGTTKIRIYNNKGTITTSISLICKKNGKVSYENLATNSGSCDPYKPEGKNILVTKLYDTLSSTPGVLTPETVGSTNYFIGGANPNNYVYYSGNLWRVMSINNNNKTMKLILAESVSTINYDKASSVYEGSNIYAWLNNDFYHTLRNPEAYLLGKVELLSLDEYNKIGDYKNIGTSWWLSTPKDATKSWYITNTNAIAESDVNKFSGVRPVITLKANLSYVGSATNAGTSANPYRLLGEGSVSPGTMLNKRYSGEYVKFPDTTAIYRIVTTANDYTKLVAIANNTSIGNVGNVAFDEMGYYEYSLSSTIGTSLNTWYEAFTDSQKELIYSGDWCIDRITNTSSMSSSCSSPSNIRNFKVGLPKIGELYTVGTEEFWTLNSKDDSNIYVISPSGTIVEKPTTSTSGVRPSIYLTSDVKIIGGQGTKDAPFEIGK